MSSLILGRGRPIYLKNDSDHPSVIMETKKSNKKIKWKKLNKYFWEEQK